MLGGMALQVALAGAAKAAGKPAARPNLVMGTNVQVCWEKFCRYWDVEPRYVPMQPGRLHLRGRAGRRAVRREHHRGRRDHGVHDGRQLRAGRWRSATRWTRCRRRSGLDVPIHVDGASGGFVAPFLQPDLVWDFQVPRVASINTSGHKYGLVYPGVGWIVWRDSAALPEDLIFKVNYLGGEMPTFALNFSRPGAQVAAQYYNFLRLGFEGYRAVHQACQDIAMHLSSSRSPRLGPFELLTDGSDLPVFAFKLREEVTGYSVFDLSDRLRMRGWQVPAYTFPAGAGGHRRAADRGAQRLQHGPGEPAAG